MFIQAPLDPARVLDRLAIILHAPPPLAAPVPPGPRAEASASTPQGGDEGKEGDDFLRKEEGRGRVPFLPTAASQVCLHASFYLYVKNGFNKLKPGAVLRSASSG